jgi:hypothetical protein
MVLQNKSDNSNGQMDMHFSIVYSGWGFKTNRTTVLSMHFKIVKSGWCLKTNRTKYCPPCLLNPDGASKQIGQQEWTCTKMVKFPFEFIILKRFIAETYPFSRKLPGKRKFSRKRTFSRNEISRKFAHFRIIFAFREIGKTVFVSTPSQSRRRVKNEAVPQH